MRLRRVGPQATPALCSDSTEAAPRSRALWLCSLLTPVALPFLKLLQGRLRNAVLPSLESIRSQSSPANPCSDGHRGPAKELSHVIDGEVVLDAARIFTQPGPQRVHRQRYQPAIWHTVNHAREPVRELHRMHRSSRRSRRLPAQPGTARSYEFIGFHPCRPHAAQRSTVSSPRRVY